MRTATVTIAAFLVLAAIAVTPADALPGPGEGPTQGACDAATDLLVCAGAEASGAGTCAIMPSGFATCAWTYGWITTAFSPVGLPGDETHAAVVRTTVCSGVPETCAVTNEGTVEHCSWEPASSCDDGRGAPGAVAKQLVLGECLKVVVQVTILIEARAGVVGQTLSSVRYSDTGEAAGATCFVDDGRGA